MRPTAPLNVLRLQLVAAVLVAVTSARAQTGSPPHDAAPGSPPPQGGATTDPAASSSVASAGETTAESAPPPTEPKKPAVPVDPRVAMERARAYYESGRYIDCQHAYENVLHREDSLDELDVDRIVEARLFYAACLIAVGDDEEADEQMRTAVLLKPQLTSPDPLVFPGSVIDRYVAIRTTLLDELRAREREKVRKAREARRADRARQSAQVARLEQLEDIASRETVIVKNSRWIAAIPFGVGQFQNGDPALGWTFLVGEAILGGGALVSAIVELGLHSAASETLEPIDPEPFNETIQGLRTAMLWGTIGFLTVASVGVLEAQISFVPEVKLGDRPRALPPPPPPEPRISPIIAPTSHGAFVGVLGTF